jgi:hypothetical protein
VDAAANAPAGNQGSDEDQEKDERWQNGIPPWRRLTHVRWPLFDPYYARRDAFFVAHYVQQAPVHADDLQARGLAFAFGQGIRTDKSIFWVRAALALGELRLHEQTLAAVTLGRYEGTAGIAVGPISIGAGPGVSLLQADYARGSFSMGALQPRAVAVALLQLGPLGVGARGYSELYWRWLGGGNAIVQGIGLELTYGVLPTSDP